MKPVRKGQRPSLTGLHITQLGKEPSHDRTWSAHAGELEGAAAHLELDQMPLKPCFARLEASEARTFVLHSSTKVTALGSIPPRGHGLLGGY
jgi:hypothetical protein